MKLNVSKETLVLRGPVERQTFWGIYQFPMVARVDGNKLLYTVNTAKDSVFSYNNPSWICFISEDMGATWKRISNEEAAKYDIERRTLLPNGDRIWFEDSKTVPVNSVRLPKPLGVRMTPHQEKATGYALEGVDEDFDITWHMYRLSPGAAEPVMEKIIPSNWPNRHIYSIEGQLVFDRPLMGMNGIAVGHDGALYMPSYTSCSRNPKNGGFVPYDGVQLFRSTDMGHSWELINYQLYVPDTDEIPNAFNMEGFNENCIIFAPDGGMVRLMRCGGSYFPDAYGPMFIQRSTDGGYTWTKPAIFDDHGVLPQAVTLKCGVTIATYGRYGVQIRATDDPSCMKWEEPIELLKNEWSWPASDGSCSNNCLIALDDHTAAIAYSDFTIKNEEGLRCKHLMYRTITVEP